MLIVHLTEQIITINQLYVHQRNTVSDKSNINKNCNLKKKKKYHLYKNKSQQFTIIRLSFCIPVTWKIMLTHKYTIHALF